MTNYDVNYPPIYCWREILALRGIVGASEHLMWESEIWINI